MVAVETYLSPVETHCMNIDYFIPDEENQTRGFSDDAMARLRKYNTIQRISYLVASIEDQRSFAAKEANQLIVRFFSRCCLLNSYIKTKKKELKVRTDTQA